MEERKFKRGDRFDGYKLREEVPAMNRFMSYLLPNRTECEAYIRQDIDLRPIDEYLAKKNQGLTNDKYTYFHVVMATFVKCFVLRPKMNRFISGNRMYQRNHISVAFVVKKRFDDKAEEGLAYKRYGAEDTIDTLRESILQEIYQCRREDVKDNSNEAMEKLMKLPHFVLKLVVSLLHSLDKKGKVPYDLIKADPNYASIFLTNIGTIGLDCGYHHLNNWGTNSFFAVVGKKFMKSEWDENGENHVFPALPLGFTLDERIADGFYYAGSIRMMKKILEKPEILELPFDTPVEY